MSFEMPDYLETVARFGLERWLTTGAADVFADANGNIAITRDSDLQMGPPPVNAMFRLVARWRATDQAMRVLFQQINAAESLAEESTAAAGTTAFYAKNQEQIGAMKEIAATFSGTIFVNLNNTLQRFRKDVGNEPNPLRRSSGHLWNGQSLGAIVSAASNNYRHYDDWASATEPTSLQLSSMRVIADVMECEHRSLRYNVCEMILSAICGRSQDKLNHHIFEYCKAVAEL